MQTLDRKWHTLTPDPSTDILLFHAGNDRTGTSGSLDGEISVFAHAGPGDAVCFYLRYRPRPEEEMVIRPLDCRDDAAAFIRGVAGPDLDGLTEPERARIRHFFPRWFES